MGTINCWDGKITIFWVVSNSYKLFRLLLFDFIRTCIEMSGRCIEWFLYVNGYRVKFKKKDIPISNVPIVGRLREVSLKLGPVGENCNNTCFLTLTKLPLTIWSSKSGAGISCLTAFGCAIVFFSKFCFWHCTLDNSGVQKWVSFVHVKTERGIATYAICVSASRLAFVHRIWSLPSPLMVVSPLLVNRSCSHLLVESLRICWVVRRKTWPV